MEGDRARGSGGRGGRRGQRGRGSSGRGRRGGFGGTLSGLPAAVPAASSSSPSSSSTTTTSAFSNGVEGRAGKKDIDPSSEGAPGPAATVADLAAPLDEAELCFICAEPVQLYSVAPCNHRTCHVCAVRLRALYKKQECTFCKAPSETLIFSKDGQKDFLSYSPDDIPFKDDRLNIYFETATSREDTLILLRFNCPDPECDYVASNWGDLRAHARSEHDRFLCELCIKHSRIFVHEHKLFTASELSRHVRSEHEYCDFCHMNFYSSDELYIHMRDRHEQCFLCKRDDNRRDEYHRDYKMLEKHFKTEHYLCEAKECLEKKFIVFESELDFKAHQVAEHGAELSSREKRDALRVTANFRFDASSAAARGGSGSTPGTTGLSARGQAVREEEPATKRDVLGVSSLASRSHVPGAGGAADHQSRRAQFGAALTRPEQGRRKGKLREEGDSDAAAEESKKMSDETVKRHQRYMDKVHSILVHSDSKMQSFRANVKVYRAGEMSSKDLIDSIVSLVGDMDQVEPIVTGLVDLFEEQDKKTDVLQAWNFIRLERTQFPSLVPTSLSATGASSAAKGQLRNAKATSSANSNNRIWENVERAAASGGGYGGMAQRTTASARNHFPSLGVVKTAGKSSASNVPGSARHAAAANAAVRGTAWAVGAASSGQQSYSRDGRASAPLLTQPYSVEVTRDPERSNKTSVRSHPDAFPTLPSNSSAANLAAHKRALFEHRSASASGQNTPKRAIWGSTLGRIDGGEDTEFEALRQSLNEVQVQDRKKGKQKNVLVTLGTSRRG